MIDILYMAWNRREFTAASLGALEANTDWSQVRRCWLYDDGSTDGTDDLLEQFAGHDPRRLVLQTDFRSPVASMNDYLQRRDPPEWFCKIDSDVVLPPGWLTESLSILKRHPHVDLLGLEAKHALPMAGPGSPRRAAIPTDHIGGVGLMRRRAFASSGWLPVPAGRMGFSDWQVKNPDVVKAWIAPALPVILLDRLPFDPWRRLSQEYEARGWQRPWKLDSDPKLWEWWTK